MPSDYARLPGNRIIFDADRAFIRYPIELSVHILNIVEIQKREKERKRYVFNIYNLISLSIFLDTSKYILLQYDTFKRSLKRYSNKVSLLLLLL